jgi:hypothetical protein
MDDGVVCVSFAVNMAKFGNINADELYFVSFIYFSIFDATSKTALKVKWVVPFMTAWNTSDIYWLTTWVRPVVLVIEIKSGARCLFIEIRLETGVLFIEITR